MSILQPFKNNKLKAKNLLKILWTISDLDTQYTNISQEETNQICLNKVVKEPETAEVRLRGFYSFLLKIHFLFIFDSTLCKLNDGGMAMGPPQAHHQLMSF